MLPNLGQSLLLLACAICSKMPGAGSIWALARENLSSEVCEQQRRRPACASAQTDQRLYYSLTGKYHIVTCFERNFPILDSLCSRGLRDCFESRFFGNPEDRLSRLEAHIMHLYRMVFFDCFIVAKWMVRSELYVRWKFFRWHCQQPKGNYVYSG